MAKSFHVTTVLRTIGLTALFALAAAATSVEAQQSGATEPPAAGQNESATFEVLINGLSSNKFNTRRTSYDQLVAAGSLAVGALEKGAKSDQLEVATRCVEALTQISRDPKGVEIALPALERLSEEAANRITAIAAARVKELKTTDEERAIAKLTSLGVRVSRSKEGNATSVSIVTDRQAYYLQFLPKLSSVFMRSNEITDAAIAPILDLPSISTLFFSDVSITDDGLGKLKNLSKLGFLSLQDTQISADGIRHLTDFPSLRILSFQPDSLDQLKIIEGITKLDALMLSKFEFDREAVDVLNRLRAIRRVDLEVSAFDDTQWEWMSMIEIPLRIRISRVEDVSDAGWENLSRASLVNLSVYSTAIEDHSLRHLRNAKELESLSITNADITDAGIAHLHGHGKLTTIRLSGTKVTKDGIAKLEQATPSLRRVTLSEGRLPFNLRAPSVGFTDNRTTGGRNAHLRGAITICNRCHPSIFDIQSFSAGQGDPFSGPTFVASTAVIFS
jgi:Leucine-rich repeat (LRR) protein